MNKYDNPCNKIINISIILLGLFMANLFRIVNTICMKAARNRKYQALIKVLSKFLSFPFLSFPTIKEIKTVSINKPYTPY